MFEFFNLPNKRYFVKAPTNLTNLENLQSSNLVVNSIRNRSLRKLGSKLSRAHRIQSVNENKIHPVVYKPINNRKKRSYSKHVDASTILAQMRRTPTMSKLVSILQIDGRRWKCFVNSIKNKQQKELTLKNCDKVGLDSKPTKNLKKFSEQSLVFTLLKQIENDVKNSTKISLGHRNENTSFNSLLFVYFLCV